MISSGTVHLSAVPAQRCSLHETAAATETTASRRGSTLRAIVTS